MGPSIAQGGFDAALIRPGSLHLICERHLGSEALPRKLIDSPPLRPLGPVATGAQVRWIAQLRTGSPLCLQSKALNRAKARALLSLRGNSKICDVLPN